MLQINANLQRELSLILAEIYAEPAGFLTLTRVLVSPDLRTATAWISILDNSKAESTIELLNKRSYELYKPLSQRLNMKHIPKLAFKLDDQIDELNRIDLLLDEAKK